ncbi:hypothetical protein L3Q82_003445 [Scortum barcoo]|uniref:Uncharacterized protein n=1 Tax=Scortum barcoo TaxID=214431 RepID=A0ACB8VNF3_9TELE|nr:hypothetical protein L3Q82_003445 [Scortum barcoo]
MCQVTGFRRKAMDQYIEVSLRSGIICPSLLPAGAGFFFVATHQHHVHQVLIRLLEHQPYVKAEKCEFQTSSVFFLSYVISTNHTRIDPEKVP